MSMATKCPDVISLVCNLNRITECLGAGRDLERSSSSTSLLEQEDLGQVTQGSHAGGF